MTGKKEQKYMKQYHEYIAKVGMNKDAMSYYQWKKYKGLIKSEPSESYGGTTERTKKVKRSMSDAGVTEDEMKRMM